MADHSISITGISLLPDEWAAELQYPDWVARRFSKIHHSLQVLSCPVPCDHIPVLSLADIAVVSALGYVGLRYADNFSWQDKYPVLARFMRA